MASFVPLVPQQKRVSLTRSAASAADPAFGAPVRWTLRVLSWLAFGAASYLAWNAINQTPVAGCTVGSNVGCDLVLSSSWSKWLGIPVAVLGLLCYASLAALSVLLGLRSAPANRWIATIFVALSMIAAAASLWFIAIQVFAIHSFCPYCLVADTCGIAIGVIATVFAARAVYSQRGVPQPRTIQPGLMALRTTLPTGSRSASPPLPMPAEPSTPWLLPAVGGAVPVVVLFIGGQILFAAKTFDVQKVALNDSIQMVSAKSEGTSNPAAAPETHVALRVPNEIDTNEKPAAKGDPSKTDTTSAVAAKGNSTGDPKTTAEPKVSAEPAPPAKQRIMTFLSGKLKLDVYQHPIIGSPDAPHIVIEMVSYDCPHCRKMHATMQHALERYGDQVAILIMVQPLDKDCNRLVTNPAASHQGACTAARAAIGIARLNPSAFAKFHDFMMSGKDKPPEVGAVVPKAYVLADRTKLRELTSGKELAKQLDEYIDLFEKLQKTSGKKDFGLPVQILGDYVMSGSVEKEEDVFKAWEEHLGVKPK